jgi:hypothetical protein
VRHTYGGLASSLLLLLGCLTSAPDRAQALTHIYFYVTTIASGDDQCIFIDGPWFRTSGPVRLTDNTNRQLVYTAEVNLFSPLGEWTISRAIDCDPSRRDQKLAFCVARLPDDDLNLLAVDHGVLRYDDPDLRPCGAASMGTEIVAAAHLGHDESAARAAAASPAAAGAGTPTQGKARLGSDHFRFEGRAGDTIELALERDGARGSTGELARLSLGGERGDALGKREGALPLELKATLPATGHYRIEVAEVAGGSGGEAFRGHYRLRVSSASGAPILLEPLRSVEP